MSQPSTTPYSSLHPAGDAGILIADLFWWLVGGSILVWLIFVFLQFFVVRSGGTGNQRKSNFLIIGGGALFPLIVISFTIYYSLKPLPELLKSPPKDSIRIHVSGLQWWWRVSYEHGNDLVELANEIVLPVNKPVSFFLKSEDVIHSFWIPSLGGKMDMIPGRVNQLTFTPVKTGEYMGICAEYCGTSHALMRLNVKVVEENVFNDWIKEQAKPALKNNHSGEKAFSSHGCIACHTVRGFSEIGKIGPDLTHIGSRMRLGAGIMKNNFHSMNKWVHSADLLKPGAKMPSFENISVEEREAIASWLEGLK